MASSLTFGALQTQRPGVYAAVDNSALAGSALTVGTLAVVGDFPQLQQATPKEFQTPRSLVELDTSDAVLAEIAKVAFGPARDARVPGGANKLVLCSAGVSTQAARTLNDSGATPALTVKSKLWGTVGNRGTIKVANNATSGLDYTVKRDGVTETYAGVESGNVATWNYDESEATAVTVEADPNATNKLKIVNERNDLTVAGAPYTPVNMAWDGKITVTPDTDPAANTVKVTITGTSKATGLSASENNTFTSTTPWVTTNSYSDVSEIKVEDVGGSYTDKIVVSVDAFVFTTGTVRAAVDAVNAKTDRGFNAVAVHAKIASINLTDLDKKTSASILSATVAVVADLWDAVTKIGASALVTPSRAANAEGPPDVTGTAQSLTGGTATAPATADYTTALAALESVDAQHVVAMSDVAAVHAVVLTHCMTMAAEGANERNAWLGAAKDEQRAALQTRATNLNSRHTSLVFQEVQTLKPDGTLAWKEPYWLALMLAAMQAGTEIGTPLTRKRPDVYDVRQHSSFTMPGDSNLLIDDAVVSLTKDRLGFRVERSVTTHLADDNPVLTEVSANESIDASIRDLRQNLDSMIGDKVTGATQAFLESRAETRLRAQVRDEIIRNWRNVVVEDLGDTFRVGYEAAPVEPLNFLTLYATVGRF